MTAIQIIDMALAKTGIPQGELAKRLGWSRQLLSSRINTGKFSVEEWETIAGVLDADLQIIFVFKDGTKAGLIK